MTKAKLTEMTDFIQSDLNSKGFSFTSTSDKNRFVIKRNKETGLILVNNQIPLEELIGLNINVKLDLGENATNIVIFYKDGKTFFKRMVDSSSWRVDKSLKKYTQQEINQIISLTIQERYALMDFNQRLVDNFSQRDLTDKILYYYQPESERLVQSIRKFIPMSVEFDYSHIKKEDNGYNFARDTISKTYFFLNEK